LLKIEKLPGIPRNEQVSGSSPLIGSPKTASNDAEKADFEAVFILGEIAWKRACKKCAR
jgi:hypothetical protein